MLAGYYTVASGMMTRQKEMDVLGNNLINAQTPGYRADRMVISSFDQQLMTRREANGSQVLGQGVHATSSVVGAEIPMFNMGTFQDTGRGMDIAIGGEGFFSVQNATGETYLTRNGQFDMDAQGYLVLPDYGRVLGTGGAPIQVGSTDFQVESNGAIYGADGRYLNQLQITRPQDYALLIKNDNGMFQMAQGAQQEASTGYEIAQRTLELSNVDMNREMTYLIESQRAFQACSSALQMVDAMNRKSVTQIGSING